MDASGVRSPWVQPYYRSTDVLVTPLVDRREHTHLLTLFFFIESSSPVILRTLYAIIMFEGIAKFSREESMTTHVHQPVNSLY